MYCSLGPIWFDMVRWHASSLSRLEIRIPFSNSANESQSTGDQVAIFFLSSRGSSWGQRFRSLELCPLRLQEKLKASCDASPKCKWSLSWFCVLRHYKCDQETCSWLFVAGSVSAPSNNQCIVNGDEALSKNSWIAIAMSSLIRKR